MNLLLGAIAIGGSKAPAVTIWQMHLRLHWVAIGMLVATVLTWLVFRWRNARLKRRLNSPRQLLRELFRLHHVGWTERRLLHYAARKQKVQNVARLFLEPALWRQIIDGERSQVTRRRLVALQEKLLKA
jgi:hypothetical protein